MNFVRKPVLNFIIAVVYITILQSSIINTLYTLYIAEGTRAKAVVKEQNSDSKERPKWSLRAHVISPNVKFITELHKISTFHLFNINEFTIVDLSSLISFYESVNTSQINDRAPPLS